MKYIIVSDSSSNISSCGSDVDFSSVPLHVIVGQEDFADIEGTSTDSMQIALKNYKGKTSTSCPNTDEWIQAFGTDADAIFCVTITSVLSGSYASANAAKEIYEEMYPDKHVYVIDSLSTGPKVALIIEKIRDLILEGKSHQDIYNEVLNYEKHTELFFALASLNNFARNGRINPILAKGIGILGVRIIGKAFDGNLKPMGKARGDSRSISQLIKHMVEAGYKNGKIIIAHTGNPEGAIELKEHIEEQFGQFNGCIQENRILCSYYAEPMSLLLGFEAE